MRRTQHILVSGKVQGVSYRNFTRQTAESLGVTGWVRNLVDGRVEALVQGTEDSLKNLVLQLNSGPPRADVKEQIVREVKTGVQFSEFNIISDSELTWSNQNF